LQLLKVLQVVFLAGVAAVSVQADVISISGLDDIVIESWDGGSGDLVGSDDYCVVSCRSNNTTSCPSNTNRRRNYDVAAYTNGATDGAGNFYLGHDTSADTLLVNFEFIHPVDGTFTMTNYNVTFFIARILEGAYSCADPNSQVAIRITVPAAELATALAGTYSETFTIDACRLNNANNCSAIVFEDFQVSIPELIQITGLDDMNFGLWGGGNVQATEDFCVFRNGYGDFAIEANGTNDSGGSFQLANGGNTIPYQLEVRQTGAFFNVTPGGTLGSGTTGFSGESVRDCGGGVNTQARVTVLATDITGNPAGSYGDTVTLRVEPD